jgi:hypothetical protein
MTLWSIEAPQNHDIYTIVYLLRDALTSALSDACFFERTSLPAVEVKGAGHAELAARLGRFRDGCMSFKEREALMLTKLLRARNWATELRRLAPEVHAEIDQFLEETAQCEDMPADYAKDAQSMFHGGGSLARFLSQRRPRTTAEPTADRMPADAAYLVGGRKALYELRAACEVFLNQIEDEFFAPAWAVPQAMTPVPGLLTSAEEQAAIPGESLN